MRILSITAQKPDSTGSGVYLSELVRELDEAGHEQAVVAGIYAEDEVRLPEGVAFYPVFFCSEKLPYPVVGMSDEMPYRSTRYGDMTPEMTEQFKGAFLEAVGRAVKESDPELILCHHLYLLTALVRERFPERRIYGFCHNTDLRQMRKMDLAREFIRGQIKRLDRIFVLQDAQRSQIEEIYGVGREEPVTAGIGYNERIFHVAERTAEKEAEPGEDGAVRIVFAGKIAKKKGVGSLLRSLSLLHEMTALRFRVCLAGGAGNEEEYRQLRALAERCPYETEFPGKLPQEELARIYNRCDIFVLPSFYEGLPLTVIEALACGARVVVTDLPGIREWLGANVKGGDIRYVPMPEMRYVDEPSEEALPEFERRLAETLKGMAEDISAGRGCENADVGGISWAGIARKVLEP